MDSLSFRQLKYLNGVTNWEAAYVTINHRNTDEGQHESLRLSSSSLLVVASVVLQTSLPETYRLSAVNIHRTLSLSSQLNGTAEVEFNTHPTTISSHSGGSFRSQSLD